MTDTVTMAEACRITGLARNTLTRHVQNGKLPAVKNDDGVWSLKKSDLDELYQPKKSESGLIELRRERDEWKATAERLLAIVETLSRSPR